MSKPTNEEVIKTFKAYTQPEYFAGTNGQAYINYFDLKRRTTRKIKSREFRRFFLVILRKSGIKASAHRIEELMDELEARAFESEVVKEVFIRVGYDNEESIIIDNCDVKGTYTAIKKGSWENISNTPVPFISGPKQKPLPLPKVISQDDFLSLLGKYFYLKDPNSILLILAFLLKYLVRNTGSCVLFAFQGRQDSGKSCASELIKYLIDPTEPLLSLPPKTPEDVVILANSSYFLGYDNLSGISNDLADFFCSAVYGICYSKRGLYSNDDEIFYDLKRDILFNGINDISKRADFLDRLIQLELESIKPEFRKSKTLLKKEMEEDRPYLLYGLYDLLSKVLAVLPDVQQFNLPRMADYARIGIAIEKVLNLKDGMFLEVYNQNILEKTQNAFWEDELCCLIYTALKKNTYGSRNSIYTPDENLKGTAMELNTFLFKRVSKGSYSPKSARGFASYLKRVEPLLKLKNIFVEYERTSDRREIIIGLEPLKEPTMPSDALNHL